MKSCECCGQAVWSVCEKHGRYGGESCAYCDLCEHGRTRNEACDDCHANDDNTWRTAPLSPEEIQSISRWLDGCRSNAVFIRETPHKGRHYGVPPVSLVDFVMAKLLL